jgi:hypothetical protein
VNVIEVQGNLFAYCLFLDTRRCKEQGMPYCTKCGLRADANVDLSGSIWYLLWRPTGKLFNCATPPIIEVVEVTDIMVGFRTASLRLEAFGLGSKLGRA